MTPDEHFDDLVDDLVPEGVTAGRLFSSRALKLDTKVIACLYRGSMVFRLGVETPAHAEALALAGAELFDPSGRNHPFKDWVVVPVEHADRWPPFAHAALAFLRHEQSAGTRRGRR